jgi:hypothetical protein
VVFVGMHACFGPWSCRLLVAIVSLVWGVAATANVQGSQPEKAKIYLRGLWHSQESLFRGEARIKCKLRSLRDDVTTEIEFYVACDFAEGKVRFDRTIESEGTSQFIRTRTDSYVHLPGRGVIARYAPDYDAGLVETQAFDPRVLGITHFGEWDIVDYDSAREFLKQSKPSLRKLDGKKVALIWEYDFGPPASRGQMRARRVIFVDTEQGYSPVRLEEYFRWPDEEFDEAAFVTTVERERRNDVWVPIQCMFWDEREQSKASVELQIEWLSVNIPLDESTFTPLGLEAPGGTLVANMRLGTDAGVVEEMIPRDGKDDLPGGPLSVTGAAPLKPSKDSWLLIAINLVVVVVVVGLFLYRRVLSKGGAVRS